MSSDPLGSFDIEAGPSPQPNERTNEVDKAEKGVVQFLETREDAAKALEFVDFIEAAFDQMSFAVNPRTVLAFDIGALMRWNDRLTAALVQTGGERRSGIASICQDFLEGQLSERRLGLCTVMALARCQDDA